MLECGESSLADMDYVEEAIATVYAAKNGKGEIRRVNINIAATTVGNYRRLKETKIGTYQLFQETYHRATYETLHEGPKKDYASHERYHLRNNLPPPTSFFLPLIKRFLS